MTVIDDSLKVKVDPAEVSGLSVVIFRPDPTLFPPVKSEDEIIQFRHMRIQVFQGSLQALSTNWSAFTVFSRDEQGKWIARPQREIDPAEREILNRISARTGHTAAVVRASPQKPSLGRKLLTVNLIQVDHYFDLIAQVVQVLPLKHEQMTCVLLSDYTANLSIGTNPADFGLPPDYEHRLLLTTFWDNFADKAGQLKEGQIVKVLNLRPKIVSTNTADDAIGSSGLIAVLHGDRSTMDKVFVLSQTSQEACTILDRRRELFGDEKPSEVRRDPLTSRPPNLPVSRTLFDTQDPIDTIREIRPSSAKIFPLTTILHNDIPITAIKLVLETPDCPAKFVIKGRVKRYLPQNIEEFTRKQCALCKKAFHRSEASCEESCGRALLNEWLFMFAIEITDGIDSIIIILADLEAVRFFNGLAPCDLVVNAGALAYVKDSMQKLIQSTIPTSFCIKSYHINKERRYRLFDTILAVQ